MNATLANLIKVVVAVSSGIAAAIYAHAPVAEVLRGQAPLFLGLMGMTAAAVYEFLKLGHVKGLSDGQAQRLQQITNWKVRRLWVLLASFALLSAATRIPSFGVWFDRGLVAFAVSSVLAFFLFVPAMWFEVRDFNVAAKRREEELDARRAVLAAWDKAPPKS